MVHQHFSLVEPLTVWENVALGDTGRLDPGACVERVGEISEQYGLEIDPDDRIADLTAGLRQRVEIIKCLRRDPRSWCSTSRRRCCRRPRASSLFAALRRVVDDEGKAVALVSHKLAEVIPATDEITIMRDGRVVDHRLTADADPATLARAMVGREVALRARHAAFGVLGRRVQVAAADAVRRWPRSARPCCESPTRRSPGATAACCSIDLVLDVHAGEIVGVAGVEGNGQRTLGDVLSSLRRRSTTARSRSTVVAVATGKPARWRAPASP